MSKSPPTPSKVAAPPAGGLAWLLLVPVAICDQITKWVVEGRLLDYQFAHRGESFPVIEGLLHFSYKRNTGVAFSMFDQHPLILAWLTTFALVIIGWYAWQVPKNDRLTRVAFGLILGGAVGNLIDRHLRGYVVDFIDFIFPGPLGTLHTKFFGTAHFATFNLADTAISIGMVLLILTLLIVRTAPPEGKSKAPDAPAET